MGFIGVLGMPLLLATAALAGVNMELDAVKVCSLFAEGTWRLSGRSNYLELGLYPAYSLPIWLDVEYRPIYG